MLRNNARLQGTPTKKNNRTSPSFVQTPPWLPDDTHLLDKSQLPHLSYITSIARFFPLEIFSQPTPPYDTMTVPRKAWDRLELDEVLSKYVVLPTQGIDLDNEVDTLFDRRRFPEDIDYEALLPALRLATKLFRSEASLIFCHTIFHAKVELRNYPAGSGHEKKVYEVVHPPESLTRKQQRQVEKDLCALANAITYELNLTDPRYLAITRPADGNADLPRAWKNFQGSPSTILFSGELYTDIVSNLRAKNRQDVTEKLVYDHIKFANVMCHELAHAAGIFRWGNDNNELTIGDNVMAESGLDWETAVWGGRLYIWKDGRSPSLTDWPSPITALTYLRTGGRIFVCGKPAWAQRSWVLPPGWLLQICHKSYWHQVVSRKGRAALEVPKLVGFRSTPGECKCTSCLKTAESCIEPRSPSCKVDTPYFWKPTLDEANPLECVPNGYALLMTGWMLPERLMHKFQQEPRIVGRGLIFPAQSDQSVERGVECEVLQEKQKWWRNSRVHYTEPQSIRVYADSAYGSPEIGQSSDTKPYPITSKKHKDPKWGVFVYNVTLSICHYSNWNRIGPQKQIYT
ncbi:hypothetical protein LTS10_012087 [Elasticomyces elasticus]|nr:hypothetical protein LTS10_012087 [Elasticomyces elasticus]